jgi:hypothetical protein
LLRLDLKRLGLSRLGLSRLGLSRLGLSRLGLSRLGLSRLGLSRLGLSRLGLSRLGDFEYCAGIVCLSFYLGTVCVIIKSNYSEIYFTATQRGLGLIDHYGMINVKIFIGCFSYALK